MVEDLTGASEQVWELLCLVKMQGEREMRLVGKQKPRGERSHACAPLSASGVGQQHSFHFHCSVTTWQVAAVLHVANGCINCGCREVTGCTWYINSVHDELLPSRLSADSASPFPQIIAEDFHFAEYFHFSGSKCYHRSCGCIFQISPMMAESKMLIANCCL